LSGRVDDHPGGPDRDTAVERDVVGYRHAIGDHDLSGIADGLAGLNDDLHPGRILRRLWSRHGLRQRDGDGESGAGSARRVHRLGGDGLSGPD
jgi:hypothetical protein